MITNSLFRASSMVLCFIVTYSAAFCQIPCLLTSSKKYVIIVTIMKDTLGDFLKRARKGKRLSQEDVANTTGLARTYVTRLEHNEFKSPSAKVLINLAKVLDVPHDALFQAAGYLEPEPSRPSMLEHRDAKDVTADEKKQLDKETEDFITKAREQHRQEIKNKSS